MLCGEAVTEQIMARLRNGSCSTRRLKKSVGSCANFYFCLRRLVNERMVELHPRCNAEVIWRLPQNASQLILESLVDGPKTIKQIQRITGLSVFDINDHLMDKYLNPLLDQSGDFIQLQDEQKGRLFFRGIKHWITKHELDKKTFRLPDELSKFSKNCPRFLDQWTIPEEYFKHFHEFYPLFIADPFPGNTVAYFVNINTESDQFGSISRIVMLKGCDEITFTSNCDTFDEMNLFGIPKCICGSC